MAVAVKCDPANEFHFALVTAQPEAVAKFNENDLLLVSKEKVPCSAIHVFLNYFQDKLYCVHLGSAVRARPGIVLIVCSCCKSFELKLFDQQPILS